MAGMPWMKFHPSDWLADACLSQCAPATRGIWIDMLCRMHDAKSGELSGTIEQLARGVRCSALETAAAVADLKANGAADVTERHGVVTVKNRRMHREAEQRKLSNQRQKRHREKTATKPSRDCHAGCNASVTGQIPDTRSRSRSKNQRPSGMAGALKSIRVADLSDPNKLDAVYEFVAGRDGFSIPGSEHGRMLVEAAALRALDQGKRNKPGLFYRLLTMPEVESFAEAYIDAAGKRMRESRAPPSVASPLVLRLADGMAVDRTG